MSVASTPAHWLDQLWPQVCQRVSRPLTEVLVPREAISRLACRVVEGFLEAGDAVTSSFDAARRWMLEHAESLALSWIADERRQRSDADFARDMERALWPHNPSWEDLLQRDVEGALNGRQWPQAVDILKQRATPVLARQSLPAEDGEDVLQETLAELLQARKEPSIIDRLRIFEELPRLFAVMIERRLISWLRKRSALKRSAANPQLSESLNDPDNKLREQLADGGKAQPWEGATFDRIQSACRTVLSDFEWHLVTLLFVEGTHTRLDLASDAWVLEQLGLSMKHSESKRRRALNAVVETALQRLGRALEEADV
jgi:DNA-directed RNA polymerase specialized sigma24 family protein